MELPEPEKFVSDIQKKTRREILLRTVIELVLFGIIGAGGGYLLTVVQKKFDIDEVTIDTAIFIASLGGIFIVGVLLYKYYRAVREEDDWD